MSKTASLNIRIDPETKSGAEQLFGSFGITVTDAVNMFLRQSLMVGGLPFELKQPRYNSATEAAIQESRDIMAGRIQAKSYKSVAALMEDLYSDTDD
jgi:DNA-damage-inducible protein J